MKRLPILVFFLIASVASLQPFHAIAGEGHDHGAGEKHDEESGQHSDEHGHGEEEGVVTLSEEAIKTAKIEVQTAGPATLAMKLKVNGRVTPVSSKVAHIAPRFSGIIKEVRKDIGEYVKAGEVLALVESNQNLQPFEVRTQKSGLITARHATLGESVKEDEALFIVIDLSELWADFTVFQRDVSKVKLGQKVNILVFGKEESSTVSFISAVVDETTQSRIVRAVLSNPDAVFAPGAFVTGEIAIGEFHVSLAITYDAIQTIEGKTVAFVQKGDKFEKRDLTLGRSDGVLTEVLSGMEPGDRYVATNSFILKAELGKSEAAHEH